MPITKHNQTVAPDGTIIEETITEEAAPVIGAAEEQQARQVLRSMVGQFWDGTAPTGSPTNAQIRNWLLALTVQTRANARELDNE